MTRRFIVLSTFWMVNVDADFDKTNKGKSIAFNKFKWRVPIRSIISASLAWAEDRITVAFMTDQRLQNDIIASQAGGKRIKKDQRKLQFTDMESAKEFLFHVIRLKHQETKTILPVQGI